MPGRCRDCYAALDADGHCPDGCDRCCYCRTPLVNDECPDRDCEANYRRPTSLNRFGGRNR